MKDFKEIEDLKKQMNECLENAYSKGYIKGNDDEPNKLVALTDKAYYDGYNSGAFEVWGCLKEIVEMNGDRRENIFGSSIISTILRKYTPQDAIKCLKDYEKNEEIKVGDEVIFRFDEIGVVTGTTDDGYVYVTSKFGWSDRFGKKYVKKTGRHFDEIKKVLKGMGCKDE